MPNRVYPAALATSITSTDSNTRCRAVYCGVTDNYDFSFDGTNWVVFNGLAAGLVYPFQVVKARHNTGSNAPTAGDIVFLY